MSRIERKELEGRLITCVLPKGKGLPLVEALYEKGITRAHFAFARGFDIHDPPGRKGLPEEVEKDLVTVTCKDIGQADELFSFIYEKAGINRLGGGFMYMTRLSVATPYFLPSMEDLKRASQGSSTEGARRKPGPAPRP
ncbi:MAG: hypothetical protein KDD43_12265 [Bdellovibrionales bacterium]|nr:hypothetical protein [Bdellovibrionales bacterium]